MRKNLFKQVAGLTVVSGLGLAAGSADEPPEPAGDGSELAQGDGDVDEQQPQAPLGVLARDADSEARAAVAKAVGADPRALEQGLDALVLLVDDPEPRVRVAARAAFVAGMARMPALRRLELTATWATARSAGQRLAAARSLAERSPAPASDLMLLHLAADPLPRVRLAALEASRERFRFSPAVLEQIVEPALHDTDRAVRSCARRAYATMVHERGSA